MKPTAESYQSVGDFSSAKNLLEKGLATSQESFGPRHPLVAMTLLRLARAEKGLGERKAAKNHLEESLGILEDLFPQNLPLIQSLKSDLGK